LLKFPEELEAAMKTRITKRVVDAAKPGARDSFVWDVDVPGFGFKLTPAGKRVFVLQYRLGGRKSPWRYTIGQYGEYTVDGARTEAIRLRGMIAEGVNPAVEKAAAKEMGILVGEFVDQFLAELGELVLAKTRKKRTRDEYARLCRRFIVPQLGNIQVREITKADIARLHHAMRNTPYQANRVLAILSKLMNWAELKGHRSDNSNPCRHVKGYDEDPRQRYLKTTEIGSLASALAQAEADNLTTPYAIAAIRLLLLTGARLNEILTLQWQFVDFEERCLNLPDSKTGRKVIHLNPPALELLESLAIIDGNPFVIVGHKDGAHLVNLQKPWRAIRKIAGLDNVRLHDIRHTFATFGVGAKLSLPIIGALLGHTQAATTQRYAHADEDPLKSANDMIGQRIADAMGNNAAPPAVPLRGES
jgi:integrase